MKHPLFNNELPEGWRILTVNDIKADEPGACVAGPFGSDISSKYFVSEGVPIIRGSNLRDDLTPFVPEGFVFVSSERATKYKHQHVKAGDLVFTCWGTIGQVGIIPEDGPYPEYIISNKQLKLRPNLKIADPWYLFYYFASPQMVKHIKNRAIGAAVPGINLGILKNLEVVLPPLDTQKSIVSILRAYDHLAENNTRRIAILEEMAQALYREWFVEFRFPGHEQVRMVDSPVGMVPEGWEVRELCEVADVNRWNIRRGHEPETINYVDISSVSTGRIDSIQPYSFSEAPGRARRIVKHGDIIWAMVRPNRRSYALILHPTADLIVSTGFAVITARDVPYTYLYKALTTDEFADYLTNSATGSAYPAVNAGDFEKAKILIPSEGVLGEYDRVVSDLFVEKENFLRRNVIIRETRDLLLPKLISGDLLHNMEIFIDGLHSI